MMFIRVTLVECAKYSLARALTIALRYSAVRRQFKNVSGKKGETQLLDYQTQQMKLFPLIATMYAQSYGSHHATQIYNTLIEKLKKGDYSLLELSHHYLAGMKSVYTQETNDKLYVIRQSLGGAGYSAWSGIPRLIDDWSPSVTYEGDNTVMAQQSSNYLFKLAKIV